LTAILLSLILNTYYGYGIIHMFRFYAHNMLTDIGATVGISFSTLILAIIGLMLLWENGWRTLVTYLLMILLIVASLFNDTLRIYTNFIIMIYAGFAFIHLNKRKWSIGIIKKTTVLLIICSIFFSTLVYMTKLSSSEPTPEYVNALKFITGQSFPNEVILCSPENGYFIEYYTERMVLADDSTKFYDHKRYELIENITTSRNLERTESLLKEYNIKYIVISKEFEPYLKEKEGLLFLIENSKKFSNIYKNEKVNVWMYNS
jgi:membrane-bound ClpP family serine protease